MKRFLLLFLVMLLALPIGQAYAATNLWVQYTPFKDHYMVAYYKQIPERPSSMKVSFTNPANAEANAKKVFKGTEITGLFYLTCNGQYLFEFYDTGGLLTNTSQLMTTTLVKNNVCESYPSPLDQYNGQSFAPMNENGVEIGRGDSPSGPRTYLSWDPAPRCGYGYPYYQIYRDGVLEFEYVSDVYLYQYDITDKPGTWRVETKYDTVLCDNYEEAGEIPYSEAMDETGNFSDPWAGVPAPGDGSSPEGPKGESGGGEGGGGEVVYPPFDPLCPVCVELNQLLQCPDWDVYMGELTEAIKAALPPPPDWQDIADKIGKATVDELSDYIGEVPVPPSQAEIDGNMDRPLPVVDNHAPDPAELVPKLPAGYEQPKVFDIESGPAIDITDGSQPFEILQPLNNIQYDPPGVGPKPGASSNNSGDIQNPAKMTLPNPTPKPTGSTTPAPNNPVPKPAANPSAGPKPSTAPSAGPAPIPSSTPGTGPKPNMVP
ncbi:hypothetical protein [Paenibacillus agricola]|uniref:Uncharacterized protein n=1 Tax=Paenibacillus agricola TaxID=2716264 RepID=A0ABX0JJD0_9BACL|nr:hypothetical protein [Paenibacillus agricola]NHN35539.1 hypothetical protein [Paenibacillus agricola]